MAIDNNGWQLLSINRLILIIDGQLIMKIFVIIDYHRLSISIDKWWESNIIDCHQCAISIDYLFSQTFQLSISSSTNKVTHFDIIAFYLSKNYLILTTYIGKKKNIWNKGECLLLWFLGTRITSALLCHCLLCLSPLTPTWNNFFLLRKSLLGIPHGRSRLMWASAQTYKERRRKRNSNNKLTCVWTTIVSQVSWIFAMNLKLNRSSLYYWQWDMLIVLLICAVFHGATLMNNSQTLVLRFKNNIWSAYTPGTPEDTETWI